jgi:hypothetical protein
MNDQELPENKMSDDELFDSYLWDKSGEPSAEVQRIEKSLSQFRHVGEAPVFPPAIASTEKKRWFAFLLVNSARRFIAAGAFAALAIGVSVVSLSRHDYSHPVVRHSGWGVARREGTPTLGARSMRGANGLLEVGQLLVTNASSRATISVAEIGEVDVDPNTRVRLLQTMRDRKRISLEQGTIHARILAPPGEFVVDTPSASAVDLGCAYTLTVAPDGSGLLRTTLGWVGFHSNGRDSFIPAGALCPTRRNLGPGTPYFEDASERFRAALAQLDFDAPTPESRADALRTVISQARKQDAISLWHLLSRVQDTERAQVFARFSALVPPPTGVTHEGILALDQRQLDLWWNSLGLGDISIWRFWEQTPDRSLPPQSQYLQKKQAMLKQAR